MVLLCQLVLKWFGLMANLLIKIKRLLVITRGCLSKENKFQKKIILKIKERLAR
jgi:hypothetical protein